MIEMASHDPRQGVIFQTLKQDAGRAAAVRAARPLSGLPPVRQQPCSCRAFSCAACSPAADGRAMPQLGSFMIDHRSPLEQRWGGWYVSGTHGAARHMGNAMVTDPSKPEGAIGEATLNRSTLPDLVEAASYPRQTSDIAALMVFDHQGHAINLLTSLGWETRVAARLRAGSISRRASCAIWLRETAITSRLWTRRNSSRRFTASRRSQKTFSNCRPARSQRAIAARARSADAALQVPLQLHDLLAGVRRACRPKRGPPSSRACAS